MPWYRLEVSHGPGHQTRGLPDDIYSEGPEHYSYLYYHEELSRVCLNEAFDHLTRELDYPIGEMDRVDRLPDDIIEQKLKEYKGRLKEAKRMITELEAMKEE